MKVRKRGCDWNVGNTKSGLTRRSHDCPKSNERSSVALALALACQRTWVLWLRCDGKTSPVCRPIPIKDVEDSALSSLNTNNSPPRFHTPRTHTPHTQTHADKLLDAEEALPGGGFIPQGEASEYRRCASFQKPSPSPVLGFEK